MCFEFLYRFALCKADIEEANSLFGRVTDRLRREERPEFLELPLQKTIKMGILSQFILVWRDGFKAGEKERS